MKLHDPQDPKTLTQARAPLYGAAVRRCCSFRQRLVPAALAFTANRAHMKARFACAIVAGLGQDNIIVGLI